MTVTTVTRSVKTEAWMRRTGGGEGGCADGALLGQVAQDVHDLRLLAPFQHLVRVIAGVSNLIHPFNCFRLRSSDLG